MTMLIILAFIVFIITIKANIWITTVPVILMWALVAIDYITTKKSSRSPDTQIENSGCLLIIVPVTVGYIIGLLVKIYYSGGSEILKGWFSVNPIWVSSKI